MDIGPVGAELFHADGRTNGHDEANSRFYKFCRRAQKRTIFKTLPLIKLLYIGTLTFTTLKYA
jgi:hypothetical protein